MNTDDEFDAIAQRALADAARVRCERAEYRDGLRYIIEQCRVAISASEEDDARDAREAHGTD